MAKEKKKLNKSNKKIANSLKGYNVYCRCNCVCSCSTHVPGNTAYNWAYGDTQRSDHAQIN